MNILQVTLGFVPAYAWGGPVKAVHLNSRELIRRGHQVTVYCTNLLDKRNYIRRGTFEREVDGLRVVYFHTWRLPWWPGTLGPIWLPDLPAQAQREMPAFDVVHINGYRNLMLLPILKAARQSNVPVVIQPHGSLDVIVNSQRVKRLYDRLLGGRELAGVDAFIALQESERELALQHQVPAERIAIIPLGLGPDGFEPRPAPGRLRRRCRVRPEQPLILFLGRINRKKGADMLVEAFARLDPALDARLVIAGPDDGQLALVRSLVEWYGLEGRVIFTGLLTGDDVPAAFLDADLFVLPCRADTFPMAMIEACSLGTPMVVTDRCQIAHLVEGRVADVAPFEPQAFADAMSALLADADRRTLYRGNCPQVLADTFSLPAAVDKLECLYERLIEARNTR